MSLGDFPPRAQKIFVSLLVAVIAVAVHDIPGLLAWTMLLLAAMSVAYQVGRGLEHRSVQRMEQMEVGE